MIDCPICHVMNEDMARFCAECGQRLATPQPAPQAPQAPASAAPAGKAPKLHSPLLGGDLSAEEKEGGKADFSRLRGTPGSSYEPEAAAGERPPKSLRSPLLGGGEPDFPAEPEPSAGKPRRGLKSPLLGGGSDFDTGYEEPAGAGGSRGLRSPLLGSGPFEEPPAGKSGRGLRSPLLGGGEQDYDIPTSRTIGSASSQRAGLRSPLLGGAEPFGDEFEPPADEDNPNVLRSPLLAAKVPLSERPPRPAAPSPQMHAGQGQVPVPPVPPVQQTPLPPVQPMAGAPQFPHGTPAPLEPPAALAPGQPSPSVSEGMIEALTGSREPSLSGQQAPSSPYPGSPEQAGPAVAPAPFAGSLPSAPPAEPPAKAAPSGPPPAAAAQPEPGLAGAGSTRPGAPARFGSSRGRFASPPEAAEAPAELESRSRRRPGSRMLGTEEPEFEAPPVARFAPPAPAAGSGIAKVLIVPLVIAALIKGWLVTQAPGNVLYIADSAASILVIVCLIVLCATAGGDRSG